MMVIFEIFVLCKAYRTLPSNRHLFLGQMLLFGLFCCSSVAVLLTINPTVMSCAVIRFGTGLSFALVFASLLVKCVFLISLNSGIYLPATYQGLLLLFAVLIQVAISGQWLFNDPASLENVFVLPEAIPGATRHRLLVTAEDLANSSIPMCRTLFSHLLMSLVYVVLLILIVAMLAIKTHGIKDNYRESTYIAIAIGASIPITLGWIMCALVVTERHRDACLAFGLVATSGTIFIVMFMPKGRQLAAMGKEGLYSEDKVDQFSSLSHPYSPSFYHFKPIDYGMVDDEKNLHLKRVLADSLSSGECKS
jgi:7 transmembrane sweet-taste receptor of 3 GCPR